MADTSAGDGPRNSGVRLSIRRLTIEDAMALASWSPPAPWAVADNLEPPAADEGFWLVESQAGEIVGYVSYGQHARVPGLDEAPGTLDVVFGIAPDYRRRGLSTDVGQCVLEHTLALADGRRLRCTLPELGDAGARAAETFGFTRAQTYDVGATRYAVYLR